MSSQTPTSSKSTKRASSSSEAFQQLEKTSTPGPLDQTAAALERALAEEVDGRRGERFFWIFACSLLSYAIIVKMMDNIAATIGVFLLLVVFLVGVAAWCGVDHVRVLLERVFNKYMAGEGK